MLVSEPGNWEPLKKILKDLASHAAGALKYLPNQGNPGDALIAAGTWQLFDDIQIAPRFTSARRIVAGDTVIYGGGGNLVPEYRSCSDFLERCLKVNVKRALVLSQSIRGHEDLLKRLDDRFTLVCRDVASVERVKATGSRANLVFAPDLALYVDVDRLFAQCTQYRGLGLWMDFVRSRRLFAYYRWRTSIKRVLSSMIGHVDILRTDGEATANQPGDPQMDVPNFYGSAFSFRAESDMLSCELLTTFKQTLSVRTNRLHIGLAAALMGCEVIYLDNSYGKIRSVYDAWLSHVPNIHFENEPVTLPKFSLVMGTLGRTDEIRRFLASLQRQDYRNFELFIVDQNPDDRLVSIINEYSQYYPIQRVCSAKGLSRARNAALPLITGDLVAFPDDDCWYPDGLLSYVVSRFDSDARMGGLTGRFIDQDGSAEGHWLDRSQVLNRYTVWRGAISFSIFLRHSLVKRIGPFDEELGVGSGTPWGAGEETDYLLRGINLGTRIEFDHDLVLRHPVKTRSFDESALERQNSYEAGFGRVIRRSGFPFWYFPYLCSRSLVGTMLALFKGRLTLARFKWHGVRSRIQGWLSGADSVI